MHEIGRTNANCPLSEFIEKLRESCAPIREIQGSIPYHIEGKIAYLNIENKVGISGTHPGNLVKTDQGILLPIDLRVQLLDASLLKLAKKHI